MIASARLGSLLALCLIGGGVAVAAIVTLDGARLSVNGPSQAELPRATSPLQLKFEDARGEQRSLAEYRGKAVLLNLWATWCAPCREEMPTLDRLQAKLGGPDFQVLALSLDRGGADVVRRFYAETGVANLAIFLADTSAVSSAVGLIGLPTTLLVDPSGREIGRVVGPAEWDSPVQVSWIRDKLDLSSTVTIETTSEDHPP